MQIELIEQIIHLPIAERVELIDRVSRSVREDLQKDGNTQNEKELPIEERIAIVEDLAGCCEIRRGCSGAVCISPPVGKNVQIACRLGVVIAGSRSCRA